MFEFLRRLFGFGRSSPAPQPAPRPTPTSPVPPAPIPITPPDTSPLTLTRHESQWGPSIMVTLNSGGPEVFVRHVLADGTYGQDIGGQDGALLHAERPSVRVSIQPGSTLYLRPAGTDEGAYRVLARY